MKITENTLKKCKTKDIARLCKYLKMPEGSDGEKQSMINWLIYSGHCAASFDVFKYF